MNYFLNIYLFQCKGNIFGTKQGAAGIDAKDLTDDFWDYVFLNSASLPASIESKREVIDKMKNEFNFWYPVDLRSSGKDLIPNHLTYFIYNHIAIWDKQADKWPRSIRANGHLLLNSEKVRKNIFFRIIYSSNSNGIIFASRNNDFIHPSLRVLHP